ncbi:MAG: hypothetical protein SVE93_05575 [Candidatus Thermoplasmatota archaeon]|nr:hypothetical protein [Candidatus Thermoplasmatota archaeon]
MDKRYFLLLGIFFLAVAIRLYPLHTYALWGSDNGEYYYIAEELYETGGIDASSYPGWGKTYPYFPGMFAVVVWVAKAFDISLLSSLRYTVPVLASLSVIILYFISMEIFRDRRVSILSALILSVTVAHALVTSHSMPGSLADPLWLGCILLLLRSYRDRRCLPLLYLATIALIVTHHLTVYFLMISLLIGIAAREIIHPEWSEKLRIELPYTIFLISATFIFWFLFTNFPEHVLSTAVEGVPSHAYIALTYFALILLAMVVYALKGKIFRKLSYPDSHNLIKRYITLILVLFVILAIISITSIPGTNMNIGMDALLWYLPTLLLFLFFIVGTRFVHFYDDGSFIYGWAIAITLSFLFGAVTNSHALIPYRHAQYIAPAIALLAALGIVKLYDLLSRKRVLVLSVSALLVLCTITAYPPTSATAGFNEGITHKDLEAALWMRDNVPANSVVASDHRLSSTIFGFAKLMCTWDSAYDILHAESFGEALPQLKSCDTPAGKKRVDYVVVDKTMLEEGVALLQWNNAEPMSERAFEKFFEEPFGLVYENGEVRIFKVYWERINGGMQ